MALYRWGNFNGTLQYFDQAICLCKLCACSFIIFFFKYYEIFCGVSETYLKIQKFENLLI